jgi:hypothetical protein
VQLPAECRACGSAAKVGSEAKARERVAADALKTPWNGQANRGRTQGSQDVHVVPQRKTQERNVVKAARTKPASVLGCAVAKPPADFVNTTCISCNEGEALLPVVQYPQCVLKNKLNAKPLGRQWDLTDKAVSDVIWRTVHTVDARQRSRSSTDWIVLTTTSTTPAERGVMLHNLQLHQAESGRAHLPASLSPHPPSEHRCWTRGTIDRSGPTYSGPLVKIASTLRDKRLATRGQEGTVQG